MKKEVNLIIAIAIMIVVSGTAFYGGTVYQKSQSTQARGNFAGRDMGQNSTKGVITGNKTQLNRDGSNPVDGQIISIDDKSVTIKLKDGSSNIIMFSDSTVFNKSTVGSKADLVQGVSLMVIGTKNTDGSITAQNVQIGSTVQK